MEGLVSRASVGALGLSRPIGGDGIRFIYSSALLNTIEQHTRATRRHHGRKNEVRGGWVWHPPARRTNGEDALFCFLLSARVHGEAARVS